MRWVSTFWLVSWVVACGRPTSPSSSHEAREQPPPEPTQAAVSDASVTRPPAVEPEGPAPDSTASPPLDDAHFPPANVTPPFARTAQPGDGQWAVLGNAEAGDRAATPPAVLARTVLHPHPKSRWQTVTLAAIDLRRAAVHLVAGTEDLAWAKLSSAEPAGLVPEHARGQLVAVFNGGFQPKHGRWGMTANGLVITPPRDDGCTLALHRSGAIDLGPWPRIASAAGDLQSLRQTPPCLVDAGAVHPSLLAGRDRAWGGHKADLKTRRRSAVGLDGARQILFYAIGEEAEPRYLAEGLRHAGASSAAELDINWYWTRFLLFGTKDGESELQVTSTLIPKMEHAKHGYVRRPSTRDFFYVVRRPEPEVNQSQRRR